MKTLLAIICCIFLTLPTVVSAGSMLLSFNPCSRIGDKECTLKARMERINSIASLYDDFDILNPETIYDYQDGDITLLKVHWSCSNLDNDYVE